MGKGIKLISLTIIILIIIMIIGWQIYSTRNLDEVTVHDFTEHDHNSAWFGYVQMCNASSHSTWPEGYRENALTDDHSDKVNTSDDIQFYSQTPGNDDGYPYMFFEFEVPEMVTVLEFVFEGYSDQPFMSTVENELTIWIYNYQTGMLEEVVNTVTEEPIDSIISFAIEDGIDNYTNNSVFSVLVVGTFGGGDSTSTLACDYVMLRETHIVE